MSTWSPPPTGLACYRHAKAPAPVSCNLCERPICTDCMVSAPVGWQCPSCVKGAPPVRRMRDIQAGGAGLNGQRPYLTYGIIATCVAVFFAEQGTDIQNRYSIVAAGITYGEWWRVFTHGFLHQGLIHLLFNVLLLFQLGSALEGRLGRARFFAVYALSLAGSAIGVLLLQNPLAGAVGASGGVFGLMAVLLVLPRRGRSPIESGVGGLLMINLVVTFVIPGISIGGHLGGLAAGALGGLVIRLVGEQVDLARIALTVAVLVALTVGGFLATRPAAVWRCTHENVSLSELGGALRGEGLESVPFDESPCP